MASVTQLVPCPKFETHEEVLRAFSEGRIGVARGELLFDDFTSSLVFERLAETHGEAKISVHDRLVDGKFAPSWVTVGELCGMLQSLDGAPVPEPSNPRRMSLYGVVNIRRLAPASPVRVAFRANFAQSFSFLWVGLSPGGLHCDFFNNVLLQVSGRKRVVCFFPEDADQISDQHYVRVPKKDDLLSDANLEACPALGRVRRVDVVLGPGEALILPCAAYHAPKALSHDSVSLNAFFTPRLRPRYLSAHARKEDRLPWVVTNATISLSRLTFSILGVPLIRAGHYEVM